MKQPFFTENFSTALAKSYNVPCIFWKKEDSEFYNKNVLPPFRRFIKDVLPKLKKCDSRVNTRLSEILITCETRNNFSLPIETYVEIGAIITQRKIMPNTQVKGMMVGFTPKKIIIAGGIFGLDDDMLYYLENYLREEQNKFLLLRSNEEFTEIFTPIITFKPVLQLASDGKTELQPTNGFIGFFKEIPARFITDNILPEIIIAHYKGAKQLTHFFGKA